MVSLITHCLGMFGIVGKWCFSWAVVELVKSKQKINRNSFSLLSIWCKCCVILFGMGKSP